MQNNVWEKVIVRTILYVLLSTGVFEAELPKNPITPVEAFQQMGEQQELPAFVFMDYKGTKRKPNRISLDSLMTSVKQKGSRVAELVDNAGDGIEPEDITHPKQFTYDIQLSRGINISDVFPVLEERDEFEEIYAMRDSLVNFAKSFIGHRYRWGGTSPKRGFDCSGFIYYMFDKVYDMKVPRNSREQAKVGEDITVNDLRKGDLVFFTRYLSRSTRVGHVGLVISDKGEYPVKFIHASSRRSGVKISEFSNIYVKRFKGARRYIN